MTKRAIRIVLATSAATFVVWAGSGAHAQTVTNTPTAQTTPDASTTARGNDIVVTAQKRTESLQDVPQSITVVSGEALERQRATSFEDYLGLVPGLSIEQSTPGASRLILRGINTGSVNATIGVYVDEVPFGSSSGLINGGILAGDFDTFDVARIEVLRGPQGTLYGASSLGGVFKFITNPPKLGEFSARARGGVEAVSGGGTGYSGTAVVNAPLGEKVAIRASGYYRKDAGFINSIGTEGSDVRKNIDGSVIYGGRVSALFQPTDKLAIRLTAIGQNIEAEDDSSVEADPITYKPLYGRLSQSQFIPEFTDTNYRLFNGTLDWDLGFANLTSSTSYGTLDRDFLVDNTFAIGSLIPLIYGVPGGARSDQVNDIRKFTQEIRLASPASESFEWLVGGYYTRETGHLTQHLTVTDPVSDQTNPAIPVLLDVVLDSKYKEYAAFANATIHFGSRFDLTFGGRFSHNKQSADQAITGDPSIGVVDDIRPTSRSSDDVFTYAIAPRFELSDDVAIYARVATGYRPGGPNVLALGAPAGTPESYDSDTLRSYEAGIKAETADGSLGVDFSIFYLDWDDVQLAARVNNVGINANGGTAVSKGAEITARLRPTRGLRFTATAAYTDGRLTADAPDAGGFDGDRLPYTPKTSLGLSGDYDWSLGGTLNAYAGASLRIVGERGGHFDAAYYAANGRQRELPGYEAVDLRAGIDAGRWSIEAFAKNLGNSRGINSVFGSGFVPNGGITTGIIRPRTIGLTFGTEF